MDYVFGVVQPRWVRLERAMRCSRISYNIPPSRYLRVLHPIVLPSQNDLSSQGYDHPEIPSTNPKKSWLRLTTSYPLDISLDILYILVVYIVLPIHQTTIMVPSYRDVSARGCRDLKKIHEVDFRCKLGWEIDFWSFRGSRIKIEQDVQGFVFQAQITIYVSNASI